MRSALLVVFGAALVACEGPGETDVTICPPGTARSEEKKAFGSVGLGVRKICKPCEPGGFCAGGTQKRIACDGTRTTDHDRDPRTPCVAQPACEPGAHLEVAGDPVTMRVCPACPEGTWDNDGDVTTACVPWSDCPPGSFLISTPGPDALFDAWCIHCPRDTFTSAPYQRECLPRRTCGPGEYAAQPDRADADRTCVTCPSGPDVQPPNAPTCGYVLRLAASSTQTCALGRAGPRCWGSTVDANGKRFTAPVPYDIAVLPAPDLVAAGRDHACTATWYAEGKPPSVKCWGSNASGQFDAFGVSQGFASSSDPVTVATSLDVEQLLATRAETLVQTRGVYPTVLGGRGEADSVGRAGGDIRLPQLDRAFRLAAFDGHYCGIRYGVGIDCMRADGVVTRTPSLGAVDAGVGHAHVCVLSRIGDVRCFGDGTRGQLGDGSRAARTTADLVPGIASAYAITSGADHTCVASGGTVRCWGANDAGQLGDGTTVDRDVPTQVPGLTEVVALAAGYKHTCALRLNGTVFCWGANEVGQLGDGTTTSRLVPTGVLGLTNP